jgi:hypothetical protein
MLLSFERPSAQSGRRLEADLENCTIMPTNTAFTGGVNGYHLQLRK